MNEQRINIDKTDYIHSILNTTQDGFWIVDRNRKFIDVNEAYCNMSGYSRAEFLQLSIEDIDADEKVEETNSRIQRIIDTGHAIFETCHRRKDGSTFDVEISVSYLEAEGGQLICFCRDISDRIRSEQDLRISEQRYKDLFQNSLVSIWEEDISDVRKEIERLKLDGVTDFKEYFNTHPDSIPALAGKIQITDVNDATLPLYGARTKEELLGSLDRIIVPETMTIIKNELIAIADGGGDIEGETQGKTLKGDILDLFIQINIPAPDMGNRMIVAITDISELKEKDRQLQESERRFQYAINAVNDGIWEWNMITDEVYFSPTYFTMLGYPFDELPQKSDSWEKLVHPDDLPNALENIDNALKRGSQYVSDFRMLCKNGEWKWIQGRERVTEYDADGNPVRFTGTHIDLTARKELEKRLEKTIEKLNKNMEEVLVLQQASMAVLEQNNFENTVQIIFNMIKEITGARSGYIVQFIKDGREDEILFLDKGESPSTVDAEFSISMSPIWSEIYQNGKIIVNNDFANSDWNQYLPAEHIPIKNILFVPISIDMKVAGVLGLANKDGKFIEDDLEIAKALGQIIAIALQHEQSRELIQQRENELKKSLEEKEYLIQEIHHRVKNNLGIISSLISLKQNEETQQSAALLDLRHQIDTIQLLHDQLYKFDSGLQINVDVYFKKLIDTIFESFSLFPVKINCDIDPIMLHARKVLSIGLIINEIATNAIKYGFTSDEKPVFSFSLKTDELTKEYILTASNTGKPFPNDVNLENPNTLGMRLITALCHQIEGTLELKREPHPSFIVTFPMDN